VKGVRVQKDAPVAKAVRAADLRIGDLVLKVAAIVAPMTEGRVVKGAVPAVRVGRAATGDLKSKRSISRN
jgi:hypothetical protein